MYDVALQLSEDEVQHVVEMHADVRGNPEGLARVAFPTLHVPLATRGDVGQLDIVFVLAGFAGDFALQIENRLMMAQLQNIVDALASFSLDQRQLIQNFRRWYQWFFADNITTQAQACGNVGMVQIIRSADRNIIECGCRIALDAMGVLKKTLKLGKKLTLR
ncbi:hypothetical protein D9M71_495220 [compost metagenome]